VIVVSAVLSDFCGGHPSCRTTAAGIVPADTRNRLHSASDQVVQPGRQRSDLRILYGDAQARFRQSRGSAAEAECQIFVGQPVMDQKPIVAAFKVTNLPYIAGKMATGSGQNSGFSNLTTQLIA
jgi:hypothetical protein